MADVTAPAETLEARIAEVGGELARAFNDVLNDLPGGPHRPQWLARSLGVNTVLTSRILKVARHHDPLAVAHLIPGPEPLRRLLRSAERKKVDPAAIRRAREAVDRFQRLIHAEAGDRSSLDAIISGWLPDARGKIELIAKQSVFRGISQLLGTACDVAHHSVLLHPNAASSDRADVLYLGVIQGLRRLRPGLIVNIDIHSSAPMRTINGEPIDGLHGLLLAPFCSQPAPTLDVKLLADRAQCTLGGDHVGVQSAVNLAYATFLERGKETRRLTGEPPRKVAVSMGISLPARTHIFDVLVHENIYRGLEPTLQIYQTLADGPADPNDPARDRHRMDVLESIQSMGHGLPKFRTAETAAYLDMLKHVCGARGWDGESLRGYRCRVEFPVYSSQISMVWELPDR